MQKYTVYASKQFSFNEKVLLFAAMKDDESRMETAGMQSF